MIDARRPDPNLPLYLCGLVLIAVVAVVMWMMV